MQAQLIAMLAWVWCWPVALAPGPTGGSTQPDAGAEPIDFRGMEAELIAALNALRADPAGAIPTLEQRRKHFEGKLLRLPGQVALMTFEGEPAVSEAIDFLRKAKPLGPLARSAGMCQAAADHARDLGRSGAVSHTGSDGSDPSVRMRRHGAWRKTAGENIAFGPRSGRAMVLQLLIDDGVPGREHRKNSFKPAFAKVGVGCGPHLVYGTVCVLDLAGDFEEKGASSHRP